MPRQVTSSGDRSSVARHAQKVYHANDAASPAAAADVDGVVVFFADFGLAAFTPDGKDRWTLPLGPFKSFYGMSASPSSRGISWCCSATSAVALSDRHSIARPAVCVEGEARDGCWKDGTPDGIQPTAGPAQLVVLGTTQLGPSCALDTGEPQWWIPIGSSGSMGTPVAHGDTLYMSTTGSSEPTLPTFDAIVDKCDTNKDRRLSQAEFLADKEMGEHFGWVDIDGDSGAFDAEWNATETSGRKYGAIAVRPGTARGKLDTSAVQWRSEKSPLHSSAAALRERPVSREDGRNRDQYRSRHWPHAQGRAEPWRVGRILRVTHRR